MTALQITVTNGDPAKPTEIIHVVAPVGDAGWHYADADGDRIALFTADINGTPGMYFRTDKNGCAVLLADIEALITAVRATAERATETIPAPAPTV